MKTIFCWSVFLIVPTFGVKSQVLDQSNVFPENGTYSYNFLGCENVPWTTFDSTGTGLTWDVTGFEWFTVTGFSFTVEDAAESAYIDSVPGANGYIRETQEEVLIHRYFRVDSDGLRDLGSIIEGLQMEPALYAVCPDLLLNLPAEMGDLTVPPLDECGLFGQEYQELKLLATGQLITPAGVINDVVLFRQSVAMNGEISEKGEQGLVWSHSYQWFATGNLIYPLLTISFNGQSFDWAFISLPGNANGIGESGPEMLQIYPNPTSDRIVIEQHGGIPLGSARIVSPQGALVRELPRVGTNRLEEEIGDLSPGVYMIQTEAGYSRRFLKL
jgi:hypothetical protein